jgi:hypothetical protein
VKKYPNLPALVISGGEMDIIRIREAAIFGGRILYKPLAGRNCLRLLVIF